MPEAGFGAGPFDDEEPRDLVPLGAVFAADARIHENHVSRLVEEAEGAVRGPSHALHFEADFLALALENADGLDHLPVRVTVDDFASKAHRAIWKAIQQLLSDDGFVDSTSVISELARQALLEDAGGPPRVVALIGRAAHAVNIGGLAMRIVDAARLRRIERVCLTMAARARAGREEPTGLAHETIGCLERAAEEASSRDIVDLTASATRVMRSLPSLGGKTHALTCGFPAVDAKLGGGYRPGELILVAGRPSMGKTAFALDSARILSVERRIPTGFISLEMTGDQLIARQIAATARINITKEMLTKLEASRVADAAARVSGSPLYIDETPTMSIGQIRQRARWLRRKHGIRALFVDYLQITNPDEKSDSRATDVSEISKGLKGIARELEIPVIAVSQLSRANEARQDKRPMLSDLRESGALEQDADVVAFLFRLDYYMREKTPDQRRGSAEVIISKNRNGPTGVVDLTFVENLPSFEPRVER